MGDVRLRLQRIMRQRGGPIQHTFPDWPIADRLEGVADRLDFRIRFQHHGPDVRYPATDAELRMMAHILAHAGEEGFALEKFDPANYPARVPAELEPYVERMDPAQQGARDGWLYAYRHRAKEERARRAWENSLEGRRAKATERVEQWRHSLAFLNRNRASHGLPPKTEEEDENLQKALAELEEIEAEIESTEE